MGPTAAVTYDSSRDRRQKLITISSSTSKDKATVVLNDVKQWSDPCFLSVNPNVMCSQGINHYHN